MAMATDFWQRGCSDSARLAACLDVGQCRADRAILARTHVSVCDSHDVDIRNLDCAVRDGAFLADQDGAFSPASGPGEFYLVER